MCDIHQPFLSTPSTHNLIFNSDWCSVQWKCLELLHGELIKKRENKYLELSSKNCLRFMVFDFFSALMSFFQSFPVINNIYKLSHVLPTSWLLFPLINLWPISFALISINVNSLQGFVAMLQYSILFDPIVGFELLFAFR